MPRRTKKRRSESEAKKMNEYLAGLPEDRQAAIEAVCKAIRKNLDKPWVRRRASHRALARSIGRSDL